MIKDIEYKEIKPKYVDEHMAIAIASQDRNLKDYIFLKWKKEKKIVLGLITFKKFKIGLIQYNTDFYWHIIVLDGEYGGQENKYTFVDGEFTEEDNISCFINIETGEYFDYEDFDEKIMSRVKKPDMEAYKKYLEIVQTKMNDTETDEIDSQW